MDFQAAPSLAVVCPPPRQHFVANSQTVAVDTFVVVVSAQVAQTLGSRKMESIAFVLHSTPSAIHLSGKDEKVKLFQKKRSKPKVTQPKVSLGLLGCQPKVSLGLPGFHLAIWQSKHSRVLNWNKDLESRVCFQPSTQSRSNLTCGCVPQTLASRSSLKHGVWFN